MKEKQLVALINSKRLNLAQRTGRKTRFQKQPLSSALLQINATMQFYYLQMVYDFISVPV